MPPGSKCARFNVIPLRLRSVRTYDARCKSQVYYKKKTFWFLIFNSCLLYKRFFRIKFFLKLCSKMRNSAGSMSLLKVANCCRNSTGSIYSSVPLMKQLYSTVLSTCSVVYESTREIWVHAGEFRLSLTLKHPNKEINMISLVVFVSFCQKQMLRTSGLVSSSTHRRILIVMAGLPLNLFLTLTNV